MSIWNSDTTIFLVKKVAVKFRLFVIEIEAKR